MAGAQTEQGRTGIFEVGAAVGLSIAFLLLSVTLSPLTAAALVAPASLAAGLWRAHTLPRRSPHSLSVPVFQPVAVIHAPKVRQGSGATGGTDVNSAA